VSALRASLLLRGLRSAIVNLRNLPPFEQTELIAIEDPLPIPPLITPCAPDPWLRQPESCAPTTASAEVQPDTAKLITDVDLNFN
jgi:hypothetical protein